MTPMEHRKQGQVLAKISLSSDNLSLTRGNGEEFPTNRVKYQSVRTRVQTIKPVLQKNKKKASSHLTCTSPSFKKSTPTKSFKPPPTAASFTGYITFSSIGPIVTNIVSMTQKEQTKGRKKKTKKQIYDEFCRRKLNDMRNALNVKKKQISVRPHSASAVSSSQNRSPIRPKQLNIHKVPVVTASGVSVLKEQEKSNNDISIVAQCDTDITEDDIRERKGVNNQESSLNRPQSAPLYRRNKQDERRLMTPVFVEAEGDGSDAFLTIHSNRRQYPLKWGAGFVAANSRRNFQETNNEYEDFEICDIQDMIHRHNLSSVEDRKLNRRTSPLYHKLDVEDEGTHRNHSSEPGRKKQIFSNDPYSSTSRSSSSMSMDRRSSLSSSYQTISSRSSSSLAISHRSLQKDAHGTTNHIGLTRGISFEKRPERISSRNSSTSSQERIVIETYSQNIPHLLSPQQKRESFHRYKETKKNIDARMIRRQQLEISPTNINPSNIFFSPEDTKDQNHVLQEENKDLSIHLKQVDHNTDLKNETEKKEEKREKLVGNDQKIFNFDHQRADSYCKSISIDFFKKYHRFFFFGENHLPGSNSPEENQGKSILTAEKSNSIAINAEIEKLLKDLKNTSLGIRLRAYQRLYQLCENDISYREIMRKNGALEVLLNRFSKTRRNQMPYRLFQDVQHRDPPVFDRSSSFGSNISPKSKQDERKTQTPPPSLTTHSLQYTSNNQMEPGELTGKGSNTITSNKKLDTRDYSREKYSSDQSPKLSEVPPLLKVIAKICQNNEKNLVLFHQSGSIKKIIELLDCRILLESLFLIEVFRQLFVQNSKIQDEFRNCNGIEKLLRLLLNGMSQGKKKASANSRDSKKMNKIEDNPKKTANEMEKKEQDIISKAIYMSILMCSISRNNSSLQYFLNQGGIQVLLRIMKQYINHSIGEMCAINILRLSKDNAYVRDVISSYKGSISTFIGWFSRRPNTVSLMSFSHLCENHEANQNSFREHGGFEALYHYLSISLQVIMRICKFVNPTHDEKRKDNIERDDSLSLDTQKNHLESSHCEEMQCIAASQEIDDEIGTKLLNESISSEFETSQELLIKTSPSGSTLKNDIVMKTQYKPSIDTIPSYNCTNLGIETTQMNINDVRSENTATDPPVKSEIKDNLGSDARAEAKSKSMEELNVKELENKPEYEFDKMDVEIIWNFLKKSLEIIEVLCANNEMNMRHMHSTGGVDLIFQISKVCHTHKQMSLKPTFLSAIEKLVEKKEKKPE